MSQSPSPTTKTKVAMNTVVAMETNVRLFHNTYLQKRSPRNSTRALEWYVEEGHDQTNAPTDEEAKSHRRVDVSTAYMSHHLDTVHRKSLIILYAAMDCLVHSIDS